LIYTHFDSVVVFASYSLYLSLYSMFVYLWLFVVDVAVATPNTCGTAGSTVDFCKYIA